MDAKTNALRLAQIEANQTGKSIAVLNLNPYSPLYVRREWRDNFAGSRDLVARVDPETVDQTEQTYR